MHVSETDWEARAKQLFASLTPEEKIEIMRPTTLIAEGVPPPLAAVGLMLTTTRAMTEALSAKMATAAGRPFEQLSNDETNAWFHAIASLMIEEGGLQGKVALRPLK